MFDKYQKGIYSKEERMRRIKHLKDQMSVIDDKIDTVSKEQ